MNKNYVMKDFSSVEEKIYPIQKKKKNSFLYVSCILIFYFFINSLFYALEQEPMVQAQEEYYDFR